MFYQSQIQAISHKEGPVIVLAGPGSGKTTVITHRVKKLIEENVPPQKILVVTFTKDAATHMQKKFRDILKETNPTCVNVPVTFGTFHSIYYHILQKSFPGKKTAIMTQEEKISILREIIIRTKLEVPSLQDFIQEMEGEISIVKGNMQNPDFYQPGCCPAKDFRLVYREYEKERTARKKIDFDDILMECRKCFLEHTEILEKWQQIYEYILIDEFQDINPIQYEIIKMLARPQNNIFVVGDDDQSIYGFRGACPEIMSDFLMDFPESKKILLHKNFRSTQEIVRLSERLISHNASHRNKNMISACAAITSCPPDIRQFSNQWEELYYVSCKIKDYQKAGIRADEIAVLVRNNSQISEIAGFLKNQRIQTDFSKKNIYSGMVAQDILAYAEAAITYDSIPFCENKSLHRIINKPERYIGMNLLQEKGMNFNLLRETYAHYPENLRNVEDLQFHFNFIRKLLPKAAVLYIQNGTGYEQYLGQYARKKKIKTSVLYEQINEMMREAEQFSSLEEWVNSAKLQPEKSVAKSDTVRIMTMHRAKGLEFKVVFILDANQGIIPSSKVIREKEYQEERRIFYVAVTRAQEYLHIYGVAERLGCSVSMSMFVEECMDCLSLSGC